jgi:hypothetical protein
MLRDKNQSNIRGYTGADDVYMDWNNN